MKNNKLLLLMSVILLGIFLINNLSLTQASSPQRMVANGIYSYNYSTDTQNSNQVFDKNTVSSTTTQNFLVNERINAITSSNCFGYNQTVIPKLSQCQIYTSQQSYENSNNPQFSGNYSSDISANFFQSLVSISNSNYYFSGLFVMSAKYFVEPNFALINTNFRKTLTNYTYSYLGDQANIINVLQDASSYSFMGQNNVNASLDHLTNSTTKWFGEFTFSNLVFVVQNNQLVRTSTYHIKFNIEYSAQGVLLNYLEQVNYKTDYGSGYTSTSITLDNAVNSNATLPNGSSPGFGVLAVLIIPISFLINRFRGKLKHFRRNNL